MTKMTLHIERIEDGVVKIDVVDADDQADKESLIFSVNWGVAKSVGPPFSV